MKEQMNQERQQIFSEISQERAAQDAQWGGPTHDDSHERFEWCAWIEKQNIYAFDASRSPVNFEARMLKIAALAVAAIESSRRSK